MRGDYSDAIKILDGKLRIARDEIIVLRDKNESLQRELETCKTRCKFLPLAKIKLYFY
jgi:hypothetical protein